MAAKSSLTSPQKRKLQKSLVEGLKERDIRAKVELEKSGMPGKYRLYVISVDFEKLLEAERQDMMWQVLKATWPREDQLRLTLTLALTQKESQGVWG